VVVSQTEDGWRAKVVDENGKMVKETADWEGWFETESDALFFLLARVMFPLGFIAYSIGHQPVPAGFVAWVETRHRMLKAAEKK
jgi:hypothetical protein